MKFLIFLSAILTLAVTIDCKWEEEFQILVKLSNQTFKQVNGALKLIVNNQSLNLNETTLIPNEYYKSTHKLDTKYEDLGENTNVKFHWTVPFKFGHLFTKPSIYLEQVSISLLHVRCPCTRFYCPVNKKDPIKPNQIIKLKYCGGYD